MKKLALILVTLVIASSTFSQKKIENFEPIDVESFFQKLSSITLSTWNYKDETNRNYGLMPEEIVKNFGSDSKGVIGTVDGFSVENKIGLNFTALWVIAQIVQKTNEQNIQLKSEIKSLSDNLLLMQSMHVDVTSLMQEYNKIKDLEGKILELTTKILDLQEEVKQLKSDKK